MPIPVAAKSGSPSCAVCVRPDRPEIDRLLLLGAPSLRRLGEQFGLNHHALDRHRRKHVRPTSPELAEELHDAIEIIAKAEIQHAVRVRLSILDEYWNLLQRAERLASRMAEAGDLRGSLVGIAEIGKILGQLRQLQDDRPESMREFVQDILTRPDPARRVMPMHP